MTRLWLNVGSAATCSIQTSVWKLPNTPGFEHAVQEGKRCHGKLSVVHHTTFISHLVGVLLARSNEPMNRVQVILIRAFAGNSLVKLHWGWGWGVLFDLVQQGSTHIHEAMDVHALIKICVS